MSKVLLIILGILALLAIAVVGGGYWWWQHSGKDFMESTTGAYVEARKAGVGMDEQACLDRSVAVLKTPDGQSMGGAIRNGVVLKGCLQTSKALPAFCSGVPAKSEIMAGTAWEVNFCSKLGASGQFCQSLVREVPTYCSGPERAAKLARGGSS
jgi:hypothetical protein